MLEELERSDLVLAALAYAASTTEDLETLVRTARVQHVPAGTVIALEPDDGICSLVAGGHLILKQTRSGADRVVGTASRGESCAAGTFADIDAAQPLLAVAASDADVVHFDAVLLGRIVDADPAFAAALRDRAERQLLEHLVRATSSFDEVSADEMRGLIRSVHRRVAQSGEEIVTQGDVGSEAYVIVDGSVDVIDAATERVLATLGRGAMFGEAALLNDVRRNATVRAREHTALLTLEREPLLNILQKNASARARMIDLLNSRDRPLRAEGIESYRQIAADGSEIAVLKDPVHHKYFRLTGDSLFLWERCDGTHTIRDLATALFTERRHFAPQAVIATITQMKRQGFLRADAGVRAATTETPARSAAARVARAVRGLLTSTVHYDNVDAAFAAVYRVIGPALFSRPAAVLLVLAAVAGLAAFVESTPKTVALLWTPVGATSFLLLLIPAYAVLIVLHEAAHGLAVKAVGRRVESVGVGWFWFGPIAFVDTSDTWVCSRHQRVLVAAAGLAANLVLAAIASATALWASSPILTVAAWQFAFTAYLGVVENLNPLLEFDGYYVLVDILDRPNLRRQSLAWLGSQIGAVARRPSLIRGHVVEFAFSIGTIAYIVFAAVQCLVVYRAVGQHRLAQIVPAGIADAAAWVLPVGVCVAALLKLASELRRSSDAAVA